MEKRRFGSTHQGREAELNRKVFSVAAAEYRSSRELQTPERVALERAGKLLPPEPSVLDLGVGTGRTIPALTALGGVYLGIDYSPAMVALCRDSFPGVNIRLGDVRSMPEIANESIDLTVFSFNGLDAMSHEDRLRCMREIRRVLHPRGVFLFSSHNRACLIETPWIRSDLFTGSGFNWQRYAISIGRHLRLRWRQRETEEYAIRNDRAHDFAMLHYYIHPDDQIRQLLAAGFRDVTVYDLSGRELQDHPLLSPDVWLYYLCRKAD